MSREAPEIRLIRETLEGVMHPSTASTVFFEAITASGGALPEGPTEALRVVQGPLHDALVTRLGEDEAESVTEGLAQMLGAAGGATGARNRSEEITQNLELSSDAMPVFVLSSSDQLAEQLRAVVGPHLMSSLVVGDAELLRERLSQVPPGFVLIDGSQFPAIEPADLAAILKKLPALVVKALWGADLPYGQSVLAEAQRAGLGLTPFDRREGIEPLIDVIRSRHVGG